MYSPIFITHVDIVKLGRITENECLPCKLLSKCWVLSWQHCHKYKTISFVKRLKQMCRESNKWFFLLIC